MSADETRQSVLTSDEKDHLWATWMRGGGLASDDSRFWAEVDKIIVARVAERLAGERALALQAMARTFRTAAAPAWGGSERWMTTGVGAADLAASWCEDAALDYLEGER